MIVADTNVMSEPLRPAPDSAVLAWLTDHSHEIAITAITVGELRCGVFRLPSGARRDNLAAAVEALIQGAGDRVLPYDGASVWQFSLLRSRREAAGHVVGVEDTMIAAICLARDVDLATRNIKDFSDTGLTLHNPWIQ